MKRMKRLIAMMVIMIMVLGMNLNVFADTTSKASEAYQIAIEGVNPGEIYSAYKVFDVSFSENADKTKNYTYTIDVNSEFLDFVNKYEYYEGKKAFGLTLNEAETYYVVSVNTEKDEQGKEVPLFDEIAAKDFAAKLSEMCPVLALPDGATGNVAAEIMKDENGNVISYEDNLTGKTVDKNITERANNNQTIMYWRNLSYGYWFVTTSTGTLCNLTTTAPQITISDKNTEPTVDKQVKEDDDNNPKTQWGSVNYAQVGDIVEFRTIINVQPGAKNYVLYDRLATGLTLVPSSFFVRGVTVNEEGIYTDGEVIEASEKTYAITLAEQIEQKVDGISITNMQAVRKSATGRELVYVDFKVAFNDDFLAEMTENGATQIAVYYSAILNEDAQIYQSGETPDFNRNDAGLYYGNESITEWDTTETRSLYFDLIKIDTTGKRLSGALFELYEDKNGDQEVGEEEKVLLVDTGSEMYRVATTEEISEEGFVSSQILAGHADVSGLDANTTYYLKEIEAPAGYNMVDGLIEVKFGFDSIAFKTTFDPAEDTWKADGNDASGGIGVVNQTGTELPSTGGMGTTIFYAAGGVLVLAAVVVFVTKKRMSVEE